MQVYSPGAVHMNEDERFRILYKTGTSLSKRECPEEVRAQKTRTP